VTGQPVNRVPDLYAELDPARKRFDWRWLGRLVVRLALDAALVDAAVETWMGGSPMRWWIAAPVAVYVAFTIWALVAGSRLAAPGLVTQTPAAFYLFLAVLGAVTQDKGGMAAGITAFRQPMPVVLAATGAAVAALAALRIGWSRGTAWWFRLFITGAGVYAVAAIVIGAFHHTPYPELLRGRGAWQPLPYWLRGAFLGTAVLVPLAFAREVAVSMRDLTMSGHVRWMVVFGLAAWITVNAL